MQQHFMRNGGFVMFKCIATLALFIASCSGYRPFVIVKRGDVDTFDNPTCFSTSGCRNCSAFNALCSGLSASPCSECTCKDVYKTFLSSVGRCVKNNDLSFFPANSTPSFLVQERQTKTCMIPYRTHPHELQIRYHAKSAKCNQSDSLQRWIWTQYNQLQNVATLKCLQRDENLKNENNDKYFLLVGECNDAETKQLWQCPTSTPYFQLLISNYFMSNIPRISTYILVVSSKRDGKITPGSSWQRFKSGTNLCSKAFGCYRFSNPSSAVLVVNTNCNQGCQGERKINVPAYQSKQPKCLMVWDKLQFWDYNDWKPLPFIEKPFWITEEESDTLLEWDLTSASQKWNGLIVRSHIYCAQRLITPPPRDTSCIVIKFTGVRTYSWYPPRTHSILRTTTLNLLTIVNDGKDPRNRKSPTISSQSSTRFKNSEKMTKSKTTKGFIIGACVLISVLVLGACILGLIFYKRRSHPVKASTDAHNHEKQNFDTTLNSSDFTNEDVLPDYERLKRQEFNDEHLHQGLPKYTADYVINPLTVSSSGILNSDVTQNFPNPTNENVSSDYEPLKKQEINDKHLYQGLSKPPADYVIIPLIVPSGKEASQNNAPINDSSAFAYEEPLQNYEHLSKNRRDTEDTEYIYQGLSGNPKQKEKEKK